ncbi:MAG: hypothetical protein FWF10_01780 [Clostridiales bacterium]|nr:hypothetical protein [Clostridiales bacterium]
MVKIIGVKFRNGSRVYFFDPAALDILDGQGLIVETARGQEYAFAVGTVREVEESEIVAPLRPVLRVATEADTRMRGENIAKERDALGRCQAEVLRHGLDMKVVDVESSFNGSKITFFFTADERVDFRNLVRDLAGMFRTRIELRQIGVRDEAKMLGGLGGCGRPVCCKQFLDDFKPVSIKMAKEQGLALSPTKISGLCGRLMCCLQYEQSTYEETRKKMPKIGKAVVTADGEGTVVENNAVTEKTRVRVALPDGTYDLRSYHYTHIAAAGERVPAAAFAPRENTAPAMGQAPRREESAPPSAQPRGGQPQKRDGSGRPAPSKPAQSNAPPSKPRPDANKAPRPKPKKQAYEKDISEAALPEQQAPAHNAAPQNAAKRKKNRRSFGYGKKR